MSKHVTILQGDLLQQPAVRVWSQLQPERVEPESIEILKKRRKSTVYRLCGVGPDGAEDRRRPMRGRWLPLEPNRAVVREAASDPHPRRFCPEEHARAKRAGSDRAPPLRLGERRVGQRRP